MIAGAAKCGLAEGNACGAFDGAVSVAPGVWLYQITEAGLAAEIGLKGTKYYPNKKLN